MRIVSFLPQAHSRSRTCALWNRGRRRHSADVLLTPHLKSTVTWTNCPHLVVERHLGVTQDEGRVFFEEPGEPASHLEERSMYSLKLKNALLTILIAALGLLAAFPASAQVYKCLPTCDSKDGRFLAIANGAGLGTLSEATLDLEISVPAGTTTFTVGVFDGDDGGTDGAGASHWDTGLPATYSYALYADPNRTHSTSDVVELVAGFPSISSTTMPDNDWIDFPVTTSPAAQAPSGNYYYLLRIQLQTFLVDTLNAFKVRTGAAQVGGSSLFPTPKPFSYIANITSLADAS